ncbi:hypothetical protein B0H12DRAFT_732466 [Mycena haematopus]|nr:hypothetical protein B0H12DRAFT_732466 [Mycena haematopus]
MDAFPTQATGPSPRRRQSGAPWKLKLSRECPELLESYLSQYLHQIDDMPRHRQVQGPAADAGSGNIFLYGCSSASVLQCQLFPSSFAGHCLKNRYRLTADGRCHWQTGSAHQQENIYFAGRRNGSPRQGRKLRTTYDSLNRILILGQISNEWMNTKKRRPDYGTLVPEFSWRLTHKATDSNRGPPNATNRSNTGSRLQKVFCLARHSHRYAVFDSNSICRRVGAGPGCRR